MDLDLENSEMKVRFPDEFFGYLGNPFKIVPLVKKLLVMGVT